MGCGAKLFQRPVIPKLCLRDIQKTARTEGSIAQPDAETLAAREAWSSPGLCSPSQPNSWATLSEMQPGSPKKHHTVATTQWTDCDALTTCTRQTDRSTPASCTPRTDLGTTATSTPRTDRGTPATPRDEHRGSLVGCSSSRGRAWTSTSKWAQVCLLEVGMRQISVQNKVSSNAIV